MPKKITSDIIPPERRSIRSIPLPESRPRRLKTTPRETPEELEASAIADEPVIIAEHRTVRNMIEPESQGPTREDRPVTPRYDPSLPYTRETYDPDRTKNMNAPRENRSDRGGKKMWFVALVAIVILFFVFSFFFSGATVTATPRQETATVNTQIIASKNSEGGLSYTTVSLSKEGEKVVPANGKQQVERKASGKIIISNNFSTTPQGLVKNTRFQTGDSLIYRISADITIPGQKVEAGKTTPGTLEVTVFADEAGQKYNSGVIDFTIPGFKGDPKFEKITARSKTAMTGGFSGEMNAVDEQAAETARQALRAELTKQVTDEAAASAPAGTASLASIYSIEFESSPETSAADGTSVTLHEIATLNLVLFPKKDLENAIAKQTALAGKLSSVSIPNLSLLSATLVGDPQDIEAGSITIGISGSPILVSDINTDAIKKALAGKSRGEMTQILNAFPEIAKADASISPFWKRSFPSNPEKITIAVATTQE